MIQDNKQSKFQKIFHELGLYAYFIGLLLFLFALLAFIPGVSFLSDKAVMILNLIALILAGYKVISEGLVETVKESIKSKRFRPNIHILMALGAIGAIIIGDYGDAALLILIFAGAYFLEEYAEAKSAKEITNLLKITPTTARLLLQDGTQQEVSVESLKVGDKVLVLNGDQIPTDGTIVSGSAAIDEAMITGESMPKEKHEGDEVFGGSINGNSTFTMVVTKNSDETVLAKILKVVSETQTNLTKTATFIKKFEPIYVTIVMLVAPLFYLFGYYVLGWNEVISANGMTLALKRTIILFIGASPCALAVSDIPASLSALSLLARRGVLFKGASSLVLFADVEAVAFDKTGTLTEGKPSVTDVNIPPGVSAEEAEEGKVFLVSMEKKSNHPLATAIVSHFTPIKTVDLEVEHKIGSGLRAMYDGNEYLVGKPALFNLPERCANRAKELAVQGKTVVFIAKNGKPILLVALLDMIKCCAYDGLEYFRKQEINTVMITGDNELTAKAIGKELGITRIYANVLPEQKLDIVKELKKEYGGVAMVGDGINDAPALVEATIGIAMGDGTDVAIDVADGVLVNNDFQKLSLMHAISRKLKRIVIQNIVLALSVVLLLIALNFVVTLPMGLAVAIHEGSTILVILNGLRLLNFNEKHAIKKPKRRKFNKKIA